MPVVGGKEIGERIGERKEKELRGKREREAVGPLFNF